jgi:mono/diheme cytochrome c family protein
MSMALLLLVTGSLPGQAAAPLAFADARESKAAFDRAAGPFFTRHCTVCHGARKKEGDLDLTRLDPDMKASTSAGRWALVLGKITAGEMPPASHPQPTSDEVRAAAGWIRAELKRAGKNASRREVGGKGNLTPHDVLFDPKNASSIPDAPPRLRRLSPEIYAAFLADVGKGLTGVSNPFSPEGSSDFKDMGSPKIDEPVTSQLIRNALAITERIKAREVEALLDEKKPLTEAAIAQAIQWQYGKVLARKASAEEVARLTALMKKTASEAGRARGVQYTLAAVLLLPEAVFRWEAGSGPPDRRGLSRLTPRAIAFHLAYALTDRRPDAALFAAAESGKLDTDKGVAEAARRLLDDSATAKPRILRFFREYFGYEAAREVFKAPRKEISFDAGVLVSDADALVQHIVGQDREVLRELLTTNRAFVNVRLGPPGGKAGKAGGGPRIQPYHAKNNRKTHLNYGLPADWEWTDDQPVELPRAERAGILTHPAWLVAQSTSDDNHAIHRGKWVRERLLGGVVPDIPITVDAQLPIAPEKTLRQRMAVTQQAYCWKCHQQMNDLGLAFEKYDHYGRYRTRETVLDEEATKKNVDGRGRPKGPVFKEVPADSSGLVAHTGVAGLEGKVADAVELMHRLAKSPHVEQVFVRHAFRYWMGRNETPGDAGTLQAVHKAYRDSGGSFKALLVALLSSDSFLHRVPARAEK